MKSTHHNTSRQPPDRVDFICKVKFTNTMPDLPFEPKFLKSPFATLRKFADYKQTSLEKTFKYELLTEPDLNVKIDLIDPMTYYFDPHERPMYHPSDEKLLEDESATQQNTKRSIQHRKIVPWMRKTEYISNDLSRNYGVGTTNREDTKIGYGIKKRHGAESLYKNRQSQIDAIEKTFEDAKRPVKKHYSKRGVVAVEELPIYPDFEMWKFPFAQVIFDADPLPYCKTSRDEKLVHSLIRGMMDTEGTHFVGYFSPTDAALEQRLQDDQTGQEESYKEGFKYEHKLEREYNWTVKNKATKGYEQENYFFSVRDRAIYYNELDSRVRLVRRRGSTTSKNSILIIKHRPSNAKEQKSMEIRTQHLLHPYDVAEDEEEEEAEEQVGDEEEAQEEGDEIKEEEHGEENEEDREEVSKERKEESDEGHKSEESSAEEKESDQESADEKEAERSAEEKDTEESANEKAAEESSGEKETEESSDEEESGDSDDEE